MGTLKKMAEMNHDAVIKAGFDIGFGVGWDLYSQMKQSSILDGIRKEASGTDIIKLAIGLRHLRQATKHIPFNRIQKAKWGRLPIKIRDRLPPFLTMPQAPLNPFQYMSRIIGLRPGVNVKGDAFKAIKKVIPISKITTPQGREAFNRIVLLHEGRELKELSKLKGIRKLFGSMKHKPRFASHVSTAPIVQDLNLAATLRGPGTAEVRAAFRDLRSDELEALGRNIPAARNIISNLGVRRVSSADAAKLQSLLEGFKKSYAKSLGWKKHIPFYGKANFINTRPFGIDDIGLLRL